MPRSRARDEPTLDLLTRDELLRLTARHARRDGSTATAIPWLSLLRSSRTTPLTYGVIQPSLCLIVQGGKRLHVGRETHAYGAGSYVMSALEFPTSGEITAATLAAPYLALRVSLEAAEIAAVVSEAKLDLRARPANPEPAVFVAASDPRLAACFLRLVQLLDEPDHAAFLADAVKREILYRLVIGDRGLLIARTVKHTALGVGKAIDWLRRHFRESIDVDALARASRMSVSSLRHEFKATTAMGLLQFQKQLRLQEARRLLLAGEVDAGAAAFRVGYESPSQFSREYRRLFGAPPIRDVHKLRVDAARMESLS